MQLTSRKITTYLIGANIAALVFGYILRSPDLSASSQRKATIRRQALEMNFDHQEAMQRAQTCILVRFDMPLTDGAGAYFSTVRGGKVVINKKRPIPDRSNLCDQFGNTGVVDNSDGNPTVTDIRSMPPEQMKEILFKRGLLKDQPHSSKGKKP